jgi:hypothetical protein
MTPKDKAKELFDLFGTTIAERVDVDGFICNTEHIKKCALIAVDEIVKEIQCNEFDFQSNVPMSVYTYWKNVKKEIEQL